MHSPAKSVLFVIDDEILRQAAQQTLERAAIHTEVFTDTRSAVKRLKKGWPGIVISDIDLSDTTGREFLIKARKIDPEMPFVVIADHRNITTAMRALREGAFDCIEKPFDPDLFIDIANRALAHRRLVLENRHLKIELARHSKNVPGFIGTTPAMEELRIRIAHAAPKNAHVLIHGETGTGKHVIARNLHELSGRSGPFVAINCATMPEHLIDADLFAHETGVFGKTGSERIGNVDFSDQGTLFLDEIEAMSPGLQIKLLDVLRKRASERPGTDRPDSLDLRVVAATKTDLRDAASRGAFREDLYYRLNVIQLHIPPLRDRKADIPLLFQYFATEAALRFGRDVPELSPAELAKFDAYDWPGNVRELRNAAERHVLGLAPLARTPDKDAENVPPLPRQVEAFEKAVICEALRQHGGNVTATVAALGVPRKTFYDKLTKYAVVPAEFRKKPDIPTA